MFHLGNVFNLLIWELEDLKTIRVRCLRGFSLSKIVNYFLVGIGLFNVIIIEINDGVPVRECLSFHTIAENNLFLTILVCSLNLTVVSNYLILYCHVLSEFLIVIFWQKFHLVIFVLLIIFVILLNFFIFILIVVIILIIVVILNDFFMNRIFFFLHIHLIALNICIFLQNWLIFILILKFIINLILIQNIIIFLKLIIILFIFLLLRKWS